MSFYRVSDRQVVGLAIVLFLVALLFGHNLAARADIDAFGVIEETQPLLVERYFQDKWSYAVGQGDDGIIGVEIGINPQDPSAIVAYMNATAEMADNLFMKHETAEVYIRLRRPLQEAALPEAIRTAPQQVYTFGMELRDSENQPFYTAVVRDLSIQQSTLIDHGALHRSLSAADHLGGGPLINEHGYTISGITYLIMHVNREQFQALRAEPAVLGVDIGPALALSEAGYGTESSDRITFGYALSHISPEEIMRLEEIGP